MKLTIATAIVPLAVLIAIAVFHAFKQEHPDQ